MSHLMSSQNNNNNNPFINSQNNKHGALPDEPSADDAPEWNPDNDDNNNESINGNNDIGGRGGNDFSHRDNAFDDRLRNPIFANNNNFAGGLGNNPDNQIGGVLNSQADDEERQSLVNRQLNFGGNRQEYGAGKSNLMQMQQVSNNVGTPGLGNQIIDVSLNPIKDSSAPDMNKPSIRSKFPKSDRFQLALCGCYKQQEPVEILKRLPPLFQFDEQFKDEKFRQMAVKLKICETGSLVLDHFMIHPFVRVHIIDMNTYKYLAKSDSRQPGVNNKESAGFMDAGKHFTRSLTDHILPISTQMHDLRIKGMNLAQWDEEFILNEYANQLLKPNVLMLFEILDFNSSMIFENRNLLNADLLYPIAWGYLRPVGTAHIHMSRTRIQLYKHKFKYDEDVKQKRPYDPRIPSVLLEFNWPKKEFYPSFLEIQKFQPTLSQQPYFDIQIDRFHISRAPWERELGLESYERIQSTLDQATNRQETVNDDPISKKQLLKRWEKFLEFPSELPDLKIWKFDTESLGSFKIKFSNKAVSCTQASSKTLIKIFDIENGELKIVLRGHHDLIHDLAWSHDDQYMISASADYSCKVWNLTQKEIDYADKLNYTENDVMYYLTALLHPSYVYAAQFYPDTSFERDSRLIIATVCYDRKVRLWQVDVGGDGAFINQESGGPIGIYEQEQLEDEALELIVNPNKLTANTMMQGGTKTGSTIYFIIFIYTTTTYFGMQDYVHPNCLAFNENGRLFVGDSRGHISVWDISMRGNELIADNYFKIRQKELEGDEINQIVIHPEFQNKLLVHSRDNCIRLVEYESMKGPRIRKRFFGAKCKDLMIKSCVSPDGQYLVSGSEDGVPYIWNTQTHDTYRTRKYECKFLDLVSDIDWNPKYNIISIITVSLIASIHYCQSIFNMFALCGFGHQFPVLVYVYQRTEEELNQILYSGAANLLMTSDTRVSEGKAAMGGISNRKMSSSRFGGGKENDNKIRASTEMRNQFGRNDIENSSKRLGSRNPNMILLFNQILLLKEAQKQYDGELDDSRSRLKKSEMGRYSRTKQLEFDDGPSTQYGQQRLNGILKYS